MNNFAGAITPEYIIDTILRRRWFIIIPFCIFMVVGIFLAFTLPKIYRSETLILVEPQQIPANYVRTLVSSDINARIRTIKQQIMSRTNLERVIEQFKLFSEPQYEKMYLEDKLLDLRKRISVHVTRAGGHADAFAIAFQGNDPERVRDITNTLATFFIDENLKVRETYALGTNRFLDDELNFQRKHLEEIEMALVAFQKQHMGELPEQLDSNLSILTRLGEQLIAKQENLRNVKNTLRMLEKQMAEMKNIQNSISVFADDSVDVNTGTDSPELFQLQEQLSALKIRYTEKHPDVVRLKKMIAKLSEQKKDDAGGISEETGGETLMDNFNYLSMQNEQRLEVKREIQELNAEISKLKDQINFYEMRVENTPKREQELLTLKRDYENIQNMYNSLLNRKLEAEISVNMEKKQKGEQFRILDPARLSGKPISPNVTKLFLLSLLTGLGIAGGLIFLLEFFDTSFKNTEDIESYLGMPLLAVIPVLDNPDDERKGRLNFLLTIFSAVIAFILFAGFAVLTIKGVEPTLETVKRLI